MHCQCFFFYYFLSHTEKGGCNYNKGMDLFVPDVSSVSLDDYSIHVIASVLKQWLRDLPSPLMTFELYEEFLRAMGKLIINPSSDSSLLCVKVKHLPDETDFLKVKCYLV